MAWNQPVRFAGTVDEAAANYATHNFQGERCWGCDCKPWHAAAEYPCGVEVPRETVTDEVGEANFQARVEVARLMAEFHSEFGGEW